MCGSSGKCHAVARDLLQRCDWKISAGYTYSEDRRKADATHAHCRSSPGAAEREGDNDLVRKIANRDCRSAGKTRADNFVFESAGFFHLAAVQQLWRSAQLSELQCRAHLSSASRRRGTIELSFVRAHRRGSKKVSGLRERFTDIRRLWHGEGRIKRVANFSKSCRATYGCR